MAKLKDIAEEAGVSIRTVTRVLNDEPHIAPEKAQKVRDALNKLHYVPNLLARGLKNRRTQVLGIVVSNLSLEVNTRKLDSLQQQADKHGYRVMISFTYGDIEKEFRVCQEMAQFCDGLFFLASPSEKTISYLGHEKVPFVLVDARHSAYQEKMISRCVSIDRTAGIIEAIEAGKGHYETYILLSSSKETFDERVQGFREGVSRLNDVQTIEFPMAADFVGACALAEKVKTYPRAFCMCYNDYVAAGLLRGLLEHRASIPDDYGIVGFDDNSFTLCTQLRLSSVSQRVDDLAIHAMELLQHFIDGSTPENIEPVATCYVARETTK